ncbi:hypothetical protein [Micromonospora sonneratiae]|uniref:Uncharacterized protein n=1 Tax=Micromonospora sonneratiae TaxID=1184706 RepID=A0ABW3YJ26_9ACTN
MADSTGASLRNRAMSVEVRPRSERILVCHPLVCHPLVCHPLVCRTLVCHPLTCQPPDRFADVR